MNTISTQYAASIYSSYALNSKVNPPSDSDNTASYSQTANKLSDHNISQKEELSSHQNKLTASKSSNTTTSVSPADESPQNSTEDHVDIQSKRQQTTPDTEKNITGELTQQQVKELADLKKRDAEVRRHEQAHLSTGGRYAKGGASFQYTKGPDGKQYAVSGEVQIDMSEEITPEATIEKMQIIKKAAYAPAQPSAADRNVAARADRILAEAKSEILQENSNINISNDKKDTNNSLSDSTSKNHNTSEHHAPDSSNQVALMIRTYQDISSLI